MPVLPPKTRGRPAAPPEQVKKNIINSGMELLLEKGYEAATIEAIASHAGVAKKTLYRFVQNRDELLGLAVRSWTDNYVDLLHRDPETQADVIPALRSLLSAISGQALSESAVKMFRLLTTDFPGKQELLNKYHENGLERGQQLLSDWITRQQQRGWLPAFPPDNAARAILAMCIAEPLRQMALGVIQPSNREAVEEHLNFSMQFIALSFRAN